MSRKFINGTISNPVRVLGLFLGGAIRGIGEGFLAFFRFTEEDARILLSAYGFHAAEIERLQEERSDEKGRKGIPQRAAHSPLLAPSYGPIPLGLHPELVGITFGTASRRHLYRPRQ
jgi:hypothetical protein